MQKREVDHVFPVEKEAGEALVRLEPTKRRRRYQQTEAAGARRIAPTTLFVRQLRSNRGKPVPGDVRVR
jgi:predicted DNA-binding WGR domain protein